MHAGRLAALAVLAQRDLYGHRQVQALRLHDGDPAVRAGRVVEVAWEDEQQTVRLDGRPSGVDKMPVLSSRRAFAGKHCVLPKQICANASFSVRFCFFTVAKIIPSPAWCIAIS